MDQFIKNRNNKNIAVTIAENPNKKSLVFIMHGLGGNKEQTQLQAITQTFNDNGFTVVLFDTTNTFGKSDGNYEDATTTNYYEDLEDVINWASTQPWYVEPFWLVGHSLGGLCVALFAEKFPEKVKALAPISTVVSGELSAEIKTTNGELAKWEKTGWREIASESKPGLIKKLKWSHMEDRMKYDLLPEIEKLSMPVLLLVGDKDKNTPQEYQEVLFDKLQGKKEIHIIKNAPHTFKEPEHLAEIQNIFDSWIKNNL